MNETNAPVAERKARVSKSDWLKMALDVLEEGGIQAVRVERLAARLGVAKSGFYYHFRDRDDLYEALLDYWLALDHAPQRELERHPNAPQDERLRIVAEIVDKADLSRFDFAIRQWARQDPRVSRVWRQEMKKRIDTLREMIRDLGFSGDDLEMRTRLFAAYHISERDLFPDMTAKDRARLRQMRLQLLFSRSA